MAQIFSNDTIFIQESILGLIKGNFVFSLIFKILRLIPFEVGFAHVTKIAYVWLNSHIKLNEAVGVAGAGHHLVDLFAIVDAGSVAQPLPRAESLKIPLICAF